MLKSRGVSCRRQAGRLAVASICAIVLIAPSLSAQRQDPRNRIAVSAVTERALLDAFAAYSAGDDFAVEKWLATSIGARTSPAQVGAILARDETPWHRGKPMFMLEVAVGQRGALGSRAALLLNAGAGVMAGRPTPPGANPDEDRFELLWFQAALGIAQELQQYWLQQDLLDIVRARFGGAALEAQVRETRLPLARGIAAAGLCCWRWGPGEAVQWIPASQRRNVSLNDAVQLFADAATVPSLHVEALVRGAVLLSKMDEREAALTWFSRVPPHEDPVLGYVQHFTHARLLDSAASADDAAAAYRAALRFEPSSQSAAIGLAAALLRAGRADEAAAVATVARSIGTERAPSYDAAFRRGDGRLVKGWLAALRRLRR